MRSGSSGVSVVWRGRSGQSPAGVPGGRPSASAAAAACQENEPGARCHWAISPYRPAVNSRAASAGSVPAGHSPAWTPAANRPANCSCVRASAARLFTAGLSGLMAQWHLAPGSFSWDAAAAALASGLAAVPPAALTVPDGDGKPTPTPPDPGDPR